MNRKEFCFDVAKRIEAECLELIASGEGLTRSKILKDEFTSAAYLIILVPNMPENKTGIFQFDLNNGDMWKDTYYRENGIFEFHYDSGIAEMFDTYQEALDLFDNTEM